MISGWDAVPGRVRATFVDLDDAPHSLRYRAQEAAWALGATACEVGDAARDGRSIVIVCRFDATPADANVRIRRFGVAVAEFSPV